MILTGNEIKLQHEAGNIVIEPWNEERLNPNSVNVSLAPELLVYSEAVLDPKQDNRTRKLIIPEEGLILYPDNFYLGRTNEWTETFDFVPKLDGRSSMARLGLEVHITAGFGDVGFCGYWTLELRPSRAIRIYPNMEIAQLSYWQVCGEITDTYRGKYQGSREIVSSRMYREMEGRK